MPMLHPIRTGVLVTVLAALAGCTTSGEREALAQAGTEARYCPRVSPSTDSAILRRGEGDSQQFVASIAETSRSCRVIDGQLHMEVGVAGRLVPGVAARAGSVTLPVRVEVRRGPEILYSGRGSQAVSTAPGAAHTFVHVERGIRIPEPATRNTVIVVGFDE